MNKKKIFRKKTKNKKVIITHTHVFTRTHKPRMYSNETLKGI